MDIHKPKASHSWREFLTEIGTIICGILIALTLEQIVSTLEWSRKVAETREALGLEVGENLGKAETRALIADCLDRQLDALAAIVDTAATTGRLPPLPAPKEPPYYSWGSGVWSSALSAQTGSHLPPRELRAYGRLYQIIARIDAAEPQEEATWTSLFGLAGPGRPFDAEDARHYRQAIGEARELNGLISGFGVRARQMVDAYGLSIDRKMFAERAARVRPDPSACGAPLGAPPPHYGIAPAAGFAERARAHPTQ